LAHYRVDFGLPGREFGRLLGGLPCRGRVTLPLLPGIICGALLSRHLRPALSFGPVARFIGETLRTHTVAVARPVDAIANTKHD
jgi:hypothetical protein